MGMHAVMDKEFPVRSTRAEREAFREFLIRSAADMGYKAEVEENGMMKYRNVIVGDPEHAAVLFVAAQDTPVRRFLPETEILHSPVFFILQQLLHVFALFVPSVAAAYLAMQLLGNARIALAAFLIVYLGLILLLRFGPAQKENSMITAAPALLLDLMAAIPEERRKKVAFMFTDARYQGRGGSRAYAKAHEQVAYTRMTVTVDQPYTGNQTVTVARPLAEKCTGYRSFLRRLSEQEILHTEHLPNRWTVMQTDQKQFKCGIELTSATRKPVIGFVIPSGSKAEHTPLREAALLQALTNFVMDITVPAQESGGKHR